MPLIKAFHSNSRAIFEHCYSLHFPSNGLDFFVECLTFLWRSQCSTLFVEILCGHVLHELKLVSLTCLGEVFNGAFGQTDDRTRCGPVWSGLSHDVYWGTMCSFATNSTIFFVMILDCFQDVRLLYLWFVCVWLNQIFILSVPVPLWSKDSPVCQCIQTDR